MHLELRRPTAVRHAVGERHPLVLCRGGVTGCGIERASSWSAYPPILSLNADISIPTLRAM